MTADSCTTCRFFVPGGVVADPFGRGECRFNAPVYDHGGPPACWARVWPDHWCGQHKPSEPEKKLPTETDDGANVTVGLAVNEVITLRRDTDGVVHIERGFWGPGDGP